MNEFTWTCPECRRHVPNRLNTCRCGYQQGASATGTADAESRERAAEEQFRFCIKCGARNPLVAAFCQACGSRVYNPADSSPAAPLDDRSNPTPRVERNTVAATGVVERMSGALAPHGGIFGVVALFAAVALGRYAGFNLVIPVAGASVAWVVASRSVKGKATWMVPAFAVQAGHAAWFGLGVIVEGGEGLLLELLIWTGGLGWLIAKPGTGPVVFLSVFQVLVLTVNINSFIAGELSSDLRAALLVHIVFRIAAVVLMFIGLRGLRRGEELLDTRHLLRNS